MKSAPLAHPPLIARRSWVQGRRIYFEITDRRSLSFPATKYALLENALQSELNKIRLSADGASVTWDSIDVKIQIGDVAANHFVHTARN